MSSRTVFLGRLIGLYGILVALSISQTSRFRLAMAKLEIGNNSPPVPGEQWAIGPRKASGLESFLYAEIPALGPTVVGQPAIPDSRSCLLAMAR
jgi:hypothetical protein